MSLVVAVALQVLTVAAVSAATGPYTLPFFDPSIIRTQNCHQGCAYDYGMSYQDVASTRQGVVAFVVTGNGVGECNPNTTKKANYVFIRHSDNQHTLYYHLSTVSVAQGQLVSAGQKIGVSGASGYSCGAHLHYVLYSSATRSDATSLVPDGRWTTSPGRVPWLARYVTEASPSGYTRLGGTTWTTWVEFRNDGGRTWDWQNDSYGRARVFLSAVNSTGTATRNSSFYVSGDWSSAYEATMADVDDIAPGVTARFTFKLKAPLAGGTFTERFSLRANSLWWFNYATLGNYYIPISVTHCC